MDHTNIKDAAIKIVANIKAMGEDITALQNKQDIISTSDTTMTGSYPGRVSIEEIGGGESQQASTTGANLLDIQNVVTMHLLPTQLIAGSYTLSFKGSSGGFRLSNTTDTSANSVSATGIKNSDGYVVITLTTDFVANYINVSAANNEISEVMLNAGKTALPYEPYTGGIPSPNPNYPQEIKKTVVSEIKTHGKNFLDMRNANSNTNSGITITMNPDGSYSYVGTATNTEINIWLMGNWTGAPILFTIPAGKYFIQGVNLYNDGKPVFVSGREGSTIILNEDTPVTGVRAVGAVAGTTYNEIHYPIIARSDGRVYQWEPYTESVITLSQPIELYGIGDAQDTIEDGKVVRRFRKIVSDGSDDEKWTIDTNATGGIIRFRLHIANCKSLYNTRVECFSTIGYYHVGVNTVGVCFMYGNYFFVIIDQSITEVEDFRNMLAENPIEILYELATPVTEPLPLVDQAALNSLKTFDSITYVEFDSEIKPTFKGEYGITKNGGYILEGTLAGRNGLILEQSNAERVAALESTLVNNI